MKQFLLGREEKAASQSFIWYSLGGLLNAGQSALLLLFISAYTSQEEAGIYSIGYAIACLALTIGNYGIRNFQATDLKHKYSFSIYLTVRVLTDVVMLLFVLGNILRGRYLLEYSWEKCMIILLLCLLKLADSIEDVYHGQYQNQGRLDIAGKCLATRYMVLLVVFSISLLVSRKLLVSALITTLVVFVYLFYTLKGTVGVFQLQQHLVWNPKEILGLLKDCFSLFAGAFLALYIANVPKYAIDQYRSEVEQAYFSYIFMPVYVVNVLNTFIYQPMLTQMTEHYLAGRKKEFRRLFIRQLGIIILLVSIILLVGYFLGIPVLGWMYHAELTDYKKAFMILLVGSGFLATEGYIAAIITLMRQQKWLLLGYGASALCALLAAKKTILQYGVEGAAWLYTAIVLLQMLIFVILFVVFCHRRDAHLYQGEEE